MPKTTLSPYEALLETLPIGSERIATRGTILSSDPTHHRMTDYEPGELPPRDEPLGCHSRATVPAARRPRYSHRR